jgi:hypothetical protein
MTNAGNPGHSPGRGREAGGPGAAQAGQRQPIPGSGGNTVDAGILAQVLAALTHDGAGRAGQQAWTALAALAGRDRAETAAIEAARTGYIHRPQPPGRRPGRAGRNRSPVRRRAAGMARWHSGHARRRARDRQPGHRPGTPEQ